MQMQSFSVVANNSISENARFHEDKVKPETAFQGVTLKLLFIIGFRFTLDRSTAVSYVVVAVVCSAAVGLRFKVLRSKNVIIFYDYVAIFRFMHFTVSFKALAVI